MDTNPTNEQTPIEPSPAQSQEPTAVTTPINYSQTIGVTPKKKSFKRLWITLGIVLVLIGSLITGYFVIKGNADKIADDYTTSLKSYLGQVYDKTSSATASPVDVKDSLSKLSKPQLKTAFLGSISSKYTNAKALVKGSDDMINTLNTQVAGFVVVYNYHTIANQLDAALKSANTADQKSLTNTLNILKQTKTIADKAQKSTDLKRDFEDVSRGYAFMIPTLTDMVTAYNAGDQAKFTTSYNYLLNIISASEVSENLINSYYNILSSKFVISAKNIKFYADDIK
jgi:hypothetical protein